MFRKFFCFARRKRSGRREGMLGGIVARRATIKNQHQDFVQNRFEFCPKGTAILQFWSS